MKRYGYHRTSTRECLCYQHNPDSNKHNLTQLWKTLDKSVLKADVVEDLTGFIEEVSQIDEKGIAWRYGTEKNRLPIWFSGGANEPQQTTVRLCFIDLGDDESIEKLGLSILNGI